MPVLFHPWMYLKCCGVSDWKNAALLSSVELRYEITEMPLGDESNTSCGTEEPNAIAEIGSACDASVSGIHLGP